jgi:hypothetical protein
MMNNTGTIFFVIFIAVFTVGALLPMEVMNQLTGPYLHLDRKVTTEKNALRIEKIESELDYLQEEVSLVIEAVKMAADGEKSDTQTTSVASQEELKHDKKDGTVDNADKEPPGETQEPIKANKVSWEADERNDGFAVRWESDEAWFEERKGRGCCPYAEQLYSRRYGHIQNRCCTNRLDDIEPLKPVFDEGRRIDWLSMKDATILIQGDSLAEQQFLSLLCYVWASDDNIHVASLVKNVTQTAKWRVAQIQPINMTITHLRWNTPELYPPLNYQEPMFLILNPWHHGGIDPISVNKFMDQLEEQRHSNRTIFSQALPSHFPGGEYKSDGDYNLTSAPKEQVCSKSAKSSGSPDINGELESWTQNRSIEVLRAAEFYFHRGDAHIGKIPGNDKGNAIDCLHWCIAPGVLDALAMETLALLGRLL